MRRLLVVLVAALLLMGTAPAAEGRVQRFVCDPSQPVINSALRATVISYKSVGWRRAHACPVARRGAFLWAANHGPERRRVVTGEWTCWRLSQRQRGANFFGSVMCRYEYKPSDLPARERFIVRVFFRFGINFD